MSIVIPFPSQCNFKEFAFLLSVFCLQKLPYISFLSVPFLRADIISLVPHSVLKQMRPQVWEQIVGKVFAKVLSLSRVESKRKYVGELQANDVNCCHWQQPVNFSCRTGQPLTKIWITVLPCAGQLLNTVKCNYRSHCSAKQHSLPACKGLCFLLGDKMMMAKLLFLNIHCTCWQGTSC